MAITKKTLMEELELMVRDDITSQETIIRLSEENKILKDRIDKAIEYIKTHSNCGGSVQEGKFIIEHIEEIYDGMKLIDILRGEDNE